MAENMSLSDMIATLCVGHNPKTITRYKILVSEWLTWCDRNDLDPLSIHAAQ